MADYYPLIRRAIDALERPDEAARYDVYQRARQALEHQLQRSGTAPADAAAQLDRLRDAIVRIEDEVAAGAPPPRTAAPVRRAAPPAEPTFEPPHDPGSLLREKSNPMVIVGIAGVVAFLLLAGLAAYYVAGRDRTRTAPVASAPAPAPTAPKEAPRTVASKTSDAVNTDPSHASYWLRRQHIFYRTTHPAGTIIVSRSQRFLYLVQPNQAAIRYAIGVGPECENVAGLFRITEKLSLPAAGDPAPAVITKSRLTEQFGPRALYFDASRAVHGTAQPQQVGQSASVGCFLSWAPDIIDLYNRVQLNDRVVVAN